MQWTDSSWTHAVNRSILNTCRERINPEHMQWTDPGLWPEFASTEDWIPSLPTSSPSCTEVAWFSVCWEKACYSFPPARGHFCVISPERGPFLWFSPWKGAISVLIFPPERGSFLCWFFSWKGGHLCYFPWKGVTAVLIFPLKGGSLLCWFFPWKGGHCCVDFSPERGVISVLFALKGGSFLCYLPWKGGHFCVICPERGVISVLFALKGGSFLCYLPWKGVISVLIFSPARGSPLCEGGAQLCNCSVHLFQLECYLADCVYCIWWGGWRGGEERRRNQTYQLKQEWKVCVCVCLCIYLCVCACIWMHKCTYFNIAMQNKPTSKHSISSPHTCLLKLYYWEFKKVVRKISKFNTSVYTKASEHILYDLGNTTNTLSHSMKL